MNLKKMMMAALMAAAITSAHAHEGMWMLNKIDPKTAKVMKELGLQLTPQQLYDPDHAGSLKDAVVDFGDFCSGVVVSPNGLVFTNHHCGFGSIQSLSSTEHDYLRDGFVAHSYAEELPAPGLFVKFLQRTDDVTPRFAQAIASNDDEYIRRVTQQVLKEYRQKDPSLEYAIRAYHSGNEYYISSYKVYTDVRLAFTPTQTVGKFGGDTDNWMWPRQTCDFSVFRIYADRDGTPAPYSPDNVPLHTARYSQVSVDGYQQGDYCMTIGYPGSTSRYLSSYGIAERMEQQNKPRIEVRGLKQDVWTRWMRAERAVGIKYASKFASSSNYWKNSIGMNKALKDLKVIRDKQKLEKEITRWYSRDAELGMRFGQMFPALKRAYAQRREAVRTVMYYNETFSGIELVRVINLASQLGQAAGTDHEQAAQTALQAALKDYDARVDEETMAVLLANYARRVNKKYLPPFYETIRREYRGNYAAYAHDIFSRSIVSQADVATAAKRLGAKVMDDPALDILKGVRLTAADLQTGMAQTEDVIQYNERLLNQAILEMDMENPHYSDANFTMRVSYGNIQDYTAGGTHHNFYTNAQSLLDKVDGGRDNPDYELEGSITDLLRQGQWGRYADRRTGDMHLCFLSNNDITGGNSGSPMFNGRGELIGLAFDGNWEAMSGDILFNSAMQRCIGVDIRYVLFMIDRWGHASNLISELGL